MPAGTIESVLQEDRLFPPSPDFVRQANVSGMAEVLHENVLVRSNAQAEPDTAQIYGINIDNADDDFFRVSNLANQIIGGSLNGFRANPESQILIGSVLAKRLQVDAGDTIMLSVPALGEQRHYHRQEPADDGTHQRDERAEEHQ